MTWVQRMKNVIGVLENTTIGMKSMYKYKLLPLEKQYDFHVFHSPQFDDADFQAKPMILLIGQYSTGKTTFIRHLLKQDFPGIRIGPEPTTDRFIALMHGDQAGVIPGNALVEDREKQFRQLTKYGNTFLNRFQCSTLDSPVLRAMSLIDTPGILSGEVQRIDRGYDFTGVMKWFAERVDRIILLFDAHKLDISDEFKKSLEALRGNDDKIRIVLNKADMIDHQQLMRVYGALMWSLGKIFQTPEVSRVYIGSFWDQPLNHDTNKRLFDAEERDLFLELQTLPRDATLRKLNDLIKRARLARAHAYVISELRLQMPFLFGKDKKKMDLITNLKEIYSLVEKKHGISPGDLPDLKKMQEALWDKDFMKFSRLKPRLIENVNKMLANDVPATNKLLLKEKLESESEEVVEGGAFEDVSDHKKSPFGYGKGEGFDAGSEDADYICNKVRKVTDANFEKLNPVEGKISAAVAKPEFMKSKLPRSVLRKIWKLSDVDADGFLDIEEYAVAMHLIDVTLAGNEIPNTLPEHLVPPSKRSFLFVKKSNISVHQ